MRFTMRQLVFYIYIYLLEMRGLNEENYMSHSIFVGKPRHVPNKHFNML